MDPMEREEQKDWMETAAVTAPALIGMAAGIVLGDVMRRSARKPVAAVLASLGVAAVAPLVTCAISNKVKGPGTKRGVQRTLQGIRQGGLDPIEMATYDDDEDFHLGVG